MQLYHYRQPVILWRLYIIIIIVRIGRDRGPLPRHVFVVYAIYLYVLSISFNYVCKSKS